MDKNLKDYIEKDFRYNNLPKYYKKYFELWLSNLTPSQLYFWEKRLHGEIC